MDTSWTFFASRMPAYRPGTVQLPMYAISPTSRPRDIASVTRPVTLEGDIALQSCNPRRPRVQARISRPSHDWDVPNGDRFSPSQSLTTCVSGIRMRAW